MKFLLTGFFISFLLISILAIEQNQWDNFQGGTTQGWRHGMPNPNEPVVVPDGGPGGNGDAYLYVTSSGTSGPGSMLIAFNTAQWTGDYITAGVDVISMHMNNYSNENLSMRICIEGPGGSFWSVNPVILTPQSGWQVAQFSLIPAELTGGTNLNSTLSNTTKLRILHSVAGSSMADVINAQLGIDNITAATNPLPVELISFNASQNKTDIILNWVTASEINNFGFEIERKLFENDAEGDWRLIGFKEGVGTTSQTNSYTFTDDLSNISAEKAAYRLKQIDFNGSFAYSDIVYIENIVPLEFKLLQNYPNPFNPSTKIKFNLPQENFVSLKVFNSLGKEIAVLLNEKRTGGNYQVNFDASEFPSGVYYYQLTAGNLSETKKMILLR